MSAKEMFEALGYTLVEDEEVNYIRYQNYEIEETIVFNKKFRNYYNPEHAYFTVEEHQAIHQQMKELGWLE